MLSVRSVIAAIAALPLCITFAARWSSAAHAQVPPSTAPSTQPDSVMLVVPVPVPVYGVPVSRGALAPDAEAIRDMLASVAEAAVTEDGFDDVVERLVDADRNRIGAADVDDGALNGAAARFRNAWETKFGRAFDVGDEGLVYESFAVVQGTLGEGAELAAATEAPRPYAANDSEDYNLEPGRPVAVVSVPGRGHTSDLLVPMIEELVNWRVDVPNRVGGADLRTNLSRHLHQVAAELPALKMNEAEAQRHVTQHVLLALMGFGPQEAAERSQEQSQSKSS